MVDGGRVAVIGAGVSGIAAANVWQSCGYDVTVFEASGKVGGQWTKTYPGVRLQNTAPQYQFAEFPWPFPVDRHPTGKHILDYIEAAARHFGLDVRFDHAVTRMAETSDGWRLTVNDADAGEFAYVVIATGQYPGGDGKFVPPFENRDAFKGEVITNIPSIDIFKGKRVAIVGFGKTALDFSAWSAQVADETKHVFRTPRWTIPDRLLGIDYTRPFFARFGSDMMPSWCHSSGPQRALHKSGAAVVRGFWNFIANLFRFQHKRDAKLAGKDPSVLDAVMPPNSQFMPDLRSATALAPERYYEHVAHGRISPVRGEVTAFDADGLVLADGEKVTADLVCVCCGNDAPRLPYLPDKYRAILEAQEGGPALYRQLIDPRIPRLGFAGFNHGFLHIALVEIGALWQVAALRGDLDLPSQADMLASAERVAAWKRAHSTFEPTYNIAVSTRYQQYLDILMQDLGLSQWRKLPNPLAELFARYDPTDYKGAVKQYLAKREKRRAKGKVQSLAPVDA